MTTSKNKKLWMRSIAVWMSICLLITAMPPLTLQAEETAAEQQETHEAWSPEEIVLPNTEGDLMPEELAAAELAPEDTPEIVSSEDIENKGHVNRLWKQESNLNTIVFQNRDGTKTMYYYPDAVEHRGRFSVLTNCVVYGIIFKGESYAKTSSPKK